MYGGVDVRGHGAESLRRLVRLSFTIVPDRTHQRYSHRKRVSNRGNEEKLMKQSRNTTDLGPVKCKPSELPLSPPEMPLTPH